MQNKVLLLRAKVDEYYTSRSESVLLEICGLLSEVKSKRLSQAENDFVNFVDVRLPAQ